MPGFNSDFGHTWRNQVLSGFHDCGMIQKGLEWLESDFKQKWKMIRNDQKLSPAWLSLRFHLPSLGPIHNGITTASGKRPLAVKGVGNEVRQMVKIWDKHEHCTELHSYIYGFCAWHKLREFPAQLRSCECRARENSDGFGSAGPSSPS